MNYFKSVTAYYFKNFWFVMLFSLISAIYIGLLLHPFQFVEFLYNYPNEEFNGFASFISAMLPLDTITLVLGLIGLVFVTILISMLLGKIEAHFRLGKKSLAFKSSGVNNNFSSVLISSLFLMIAFLVIMVILSLLIMLVNFIFANNGMLVVSTVLNYVLTFFALLLFSNCTTYFGLVCCEMMLMGSPLKTALSNAGLIFHKHAFQNICTSFLPFLFTSILTILGCLLNVVWLSNFICVLIVLPFVCIFALTLFFDYYGMERQDTKKESKIRRC